MPLTGFKLDRKGVRDVLVSFGGEVTKVAGQVASHARTRVPDGIEVVVRPYTTDRGSAAVTILDVQGMTLQARDGVLTKAAGAVGLDVKESR